jgi:hypothetical protein
MHNKPKRPIDYTIEQIEAFRPFMTILGIFNSDIWEQFQQVERRLQNFKHLMENVNSFANTYSPLGWVTYDRLSTEIVMTVVGMSAEDGESALIDYHLDPDTLCFLGYRFLTRHYEPWRALYERAVERAGAEDYLSAIPLILSIIDGICTKSTGKHPFSGVADVPVFDSQASGPGGLSEGLALLGSTRGKLDTGPITIRSDME